MNHTARTLEQTPRSARISEVRTGSTWDPVLVRLPDSNVVSLVHRIEAAIADPRQRAIAVLSSRHGEGVSTIVENLARVIALTLQSTVACVDARSVKHFQDLAVRRQTEAPKFKARNLSRIRYSPLDHGLGETARLKGLIEGLCANHTIVLVEASPVLDDQAGSMVTRAVNGTLLVVQAEQTRLPVIREAKRRVEEAGGKLIGTVLNQRRVYIPQAVYRFL